MLPWSYTVDKYLSRHGGHAFIVNAEQVFALRIVN